MKINNYFHNKEDRYIEILKSVGYLDKDKPSDIGLNIALMFIENPYVSYHPDEISLKFMTSRPTVYRHLNKLMNLGFIEKHHYRYGLRYSDLNKAWNYTKTHLNTIIEIITEKIDEATNTAPNPMLHTIKEVDYDEHGRDRHMDKPSERDDKGRKQDDIQSRTLHKTTVG